MCLSQLRRQTISRPDSSSSSSFLHSIRPDQTHSHRQQKQGKAVLLLPITCTLHLPHFRECLPRRVSRGEVRPTESDPICASHCSFSLASDSPDTFYWVNQAAYRVKDAIHHAGE